MLYLVNKGVIKKAQTRVLSFGTAAILAVTSLSGAAPLLFSQRALALGPIINIASVADLRNAIENQADGQTWNIAAGNYGLSPFNDITAGPGSMQTGWYFPITANNITINGAGVGSTTIYGTGFTANGSWSTQDFVAIFGNNVTINGMTLMPKVEPNKTVEILGNDATIKNVTIEPNTLTDQAEYDSISDPTWAQQAKSWGGSIYYNDAHGTQTLENVNLYNSGVSVHAPNATFNVNNVNFSYSTNVDWMNDYRFYVATPSTVIHGSPAYTYHVNSTLNNMDSVMAGVGDPTTIGTDTISLDSNITTSHEITINSNNVTLNGNNNTIYPNFAKTGNDNNAALGVISANGVRINQLIIDGTHGTNLHGINVYDSQDLQTWRVTTENNNRNGLVVNGSWVQGVDLTTANNGWGGVDVDKPGAVFQDAGINHHNEGPGIPAIYVDNRAIGQVNDTNGQYVYIDNYKQSGDRAYFLKIMQPAAPTSPVWKNHAGLVLGAYTNVNLVTPSWTAATGNNVDHYEYSYTRPSNSNWSSPSNIGAVTSIPDQAFGAGGAGNGEQGPWQFRVRSISALGLDSAWVTSPVIIYDHTAPAAPTNLSWKTSSNVVIPNNGATNILGGTASWQASTSSGVDHSICKYWNDMLGNPFKVGSEYTTNVSGTTLPGTFNQGEGVHHFCIVAVDYAGNASPCSATFTITYDVSAPTGLANWLPTSGTNVTTANQTEIKWHPATDVSGPITYYYESSHSNNTNSDGSFKTPVYGPVSLGSNTSIPTPNTPEGTYYWHVKAVDSLGNATAWTTPWKLIVDDTAPTANLNFPTPGPAAKSFTVTFSEEVKANEAKNPANYFLNNWPGTPSFSSLAGHATVSYNASTKTATITFTDPAWYISAEQQWGVKNIHDKAGNLLSPNPTTKYSSPLVSPLAPTNLATTSPSNTKSVTWTWDAAVDPGGADASGVKGYLFDLKDSSNNSVFSFPTTTPDATLTKTVVVPADGTYTFYVWAMDNAGNLGAKASSTVVIDSTAPDTPTLVSPANGSTISGASVTQEWADTSSDVDHYVYQRMSDASGTSVLSSETINGTSRTTTGVADGTYYWRVVAYDAVGNSTPSPVWSVVVQNTVPNLGGHVLGAQAPARTFSTSSGTQGGQGSGTGDSTTPTPNNDESTTDTSGSNSNGNVKGDSTVNVKNAATTNSDNKFLGLGWWWLVVLAAILGLFWFLIGARRRNNDENQA